jgi:putative oxidoreductase
MNIARLKIIVLWTLQAFLAAVFLMAGGSKLASVTPMVQLFEAIGFGQWFRYVTGALEVIGAVGLLFPCVTVWAAALLAAVMACAVATHLLLIGGSPIPALGLLIGAGLIGWMRWSSSAAALALVRSKAVAPRQC